MKMNINGMEHTNSTVMVFQSDDYNKFGMINGNRSLDMNKIKKILADIERGTNLLKYCPVLVVENKGKLDLIDGQHRFAVAKKIKSPVFYILAESLSLYDIARMNSNTEKWKAKDFINCYIQLGNDSYVKLEKITKDFPGLPITTAINLLSHGKVLPASSHPGVIDAFHRGEFKADKETEAYKVCELISQFKFANIFSRDFMYAIFKVIESGVYDVQQLIDKVNEDPDQLKSHNHWRKYLTNLEEIVNKGKKNRVAIY